MPGLLLGAAIAIPTLWDGGFSPLSQSLFVLLAGGALLAACVADGVAAGAAARSPVGLALIVLAVLSVASAGWTIVAANVSIRTGLVVAAYAAVVIAARVTTDRVGVPAIAAAVAALAAIEAIFGLQAVSMHSLPDAERLTGRFWRPGGTFQYPPALALLQAGALPILAQAIKRGRPLLAGAGTAAAILAGAVLGLADSRLALGLAAIYIAGLICAPRSDRSTRAAAIAVALLAAMGGLIAPRLLGGAVGPHARAAGPVGLVALLGIGLIGAVALPCAQATWRRRSWAPLALTLCGAISLVGAIGLVSNYSPAAPHHHRRHLAGPAPSLPVPTDILHERTHQWRAAVQTWMDRPLAGAGAGAYYVASTPHQRIARSLYAHNLPLELAAELGIVGLLLAVGLYAAGARLMWLAARRCDWWLLAPVATAFLISNLLDWTWHLPGLAAIWAAACGGLISAVAAEAPPPHAAPIAR